MQKKVSKYRSRHKISIAATFLLITCAAVTIHLSKSAFKRKDLFPSKVMRSQELDWAKSSRLKIRRESITTSWNDWSVSAGNGNCLIAESRVEQTNTTGRWWRQIAIQLPDPLVANTVYDLRAVDLSATVMERSMDDGEVWIREFSSPFRFVLNNELYPLTGSLKVTSVAKDRLRVNLKLNVTLVDLLDSSETKFLSPDLELDFVHNSGVYATSEM